MLSPLWVNTGLWFGSILPTIVPGCTLWRRVQEGTLALPHQVSGKICYFRCCCLGWEGKGSLLLSLCYYVSLQLTEVKMTLLPLSHHSSTSEHKSTAISKKELNGLLGKYWDVRLFRLQYCFSVWHNYLLMFKLIAFGNRIKIQIKNNNEKK